MHLGLILPSSNTVMEEELSRYVIVHSTRIALRTVDEASLKNMNTEVERAVQLLTDCNPAVIVYGCTSGSFIENIKKSFAAATVPVVTTSEAVVNALHALHVETVSVGTPYIDAITQKEKAFLESHGFTVPDIRGLNLTSNTEIGEQETAYDLAKSLKRADAIFISCTNFGTFDVIQKLEDELGIPVVSSNSASLWGALTGSGGKVKVKTKSISGLGRLLEELP
ncbi:MAG: aspartate/glutamate racemase family protein [Theionarchaea archaeon]|nr:aspartate/glutamate racemase family protein [Theionarchaea archaeon]MBU6999790.1 aspartate/glutamate racemase family protein [Theionarchaea archaeon]MBU7020210.1 aspartate/glutamate racemase family protein [Theionarchaea archaeon]MBU7033671.1 aspartate/glutamate racemase family protein [Theionarchaea archaeon]MBU7040496.1 aspartate/glutamate racemase family protein [Theionarchaea archaeon]